MDLETKLSWAYGFLLLVGILGLAGAFGIGHVEEKSSYGLHELLLVLGLLAANWSADKFRGRHGSDGTVDQGRGSKAVPLQGLGGEDHDRSGT